MLYPSKLQAPMVEFYHAGQVYRVRARSSSTSSAINAKIRTASCAYGVRLYTPSLAHQISLLSLRRCLCRTASVYNRLEASLPFKREWKAVLLHHDFRLPRS